MHFHSRSQQYVDLIGFTGQSFLMYNDTMLRGLINIQEYRPSKLVDSYALQFRTDRPEGGVLFHATVSVCVCVCVCVYVCVCVCVCVCMCVCVQGLW